MMMVKIDVKGRTSVQHIRYKLVTTPSQLCGLVPGRRKAIEVGVYMTEYTGWGLTFLTQWGRARALRDACQAAIISTPLGEGEHVIPLTTGDVFRWLEDEGHFPRAIADT